MSLKTVCDECNEVIDWRSHRIAGLDYCEDCAKSKLFEAAIKPALCARCRADANDKCLRKRCFHCGRELPACTFVERVEGLRCIVCSHEQDVAALGTKPAHTAPVEAGATCPLCAEIETKSLLMGGL